MVFIFALRFACDIQGHDVEQLDDARIMSDDELVGAVNKDGWHRRERRRELKALAWFENKNSYFTIALFTHVAYQAIVLHYSFFKHGQSCVFGEKRGLIFSLFGPSSVVKQSMAKLRSMLIDPTAWGPLRSLFGSFREWRQDWRKLALDCVRSLLGELERRMMQPLEEAPLKYWVPIADPLTPEFEKRRLAEEMFSIDERLLDSASLSLKRRTQGDADALLSSKFWRAFMFHSMNKLGLASSFVECLFAHYGQWQRVSPKPMSPALLCAKHVTHEFSVAGERKRARASTSVDVEEQPCKQARRPEWVLRRGESSSLNGFHVFVGEQVRTRGPCSTATAAFSHGSRLWRGASAEAKAKAKATARFRNASGGAAKLEAIQEARQQTHSHTQ